MTFGSYALFTIGNQLNILQDFPEEHYKLLDDIKNAKAFMKQNKVEWFILIKYIEILKMRKLINYIVI